MRITKDRQDKKSIIEKDNTNNNKKKTKRRKCDKENKYTCKRTVRGQVKLKNKKNTRRKMKNANEQEERSLKTIKIWWVSFSFSTGQN